VHLWSLGDGKTKGYAQLLANGYKGLKAASARNKVIAGNGNKLDKSARYDLYGYNPSARKPPTAAKLKAVETTVKPHKLWLGPVELPTSDGGPFRLTLSAQASWLTKTFKLVRSDANIATLSYRNLKDEDGAPYRGLLDKDGAKKPSYNAFKRG
jgi:hypothetical protein